MELAMVVSFPIAKRKTFGTAKQHLPGGGGGWPWGAIAGARTQSARRGPAPVRANAFAVNQSRPSESNVSKTVQQTEQVKNKTKQTIQKRAQ